MLRREGRRASEFRSVRRDEMVTDMVQEYERLLAFCPDGGQSLIAWELMDPSLRRQPGQPTLS